MAGRIGCPPRPFINLNNGIVAEDGRLQLVNCNVSLITPTPNDNRPFSVKIGKKVRLAHLLGGSLAQTAKIENNATDIDFVQTDVDKSFLPPRVYKLPNVTTRKFRYFKSENLVLASPSCCSCIFWRWSAAGFSPTS